MFLPSLAAEPVLAESAPFPAPVPMLGLSPVERAVFDQIAGHADRTLSRLRYDERRRVWAHLARLCADLADLDS